MKKEEVVIHLPQNIISEIEKTAKDKEQFIIEAIQSKLNQEILIEGYSKERNLKEWEVTAEDGIG